ncbi:MAG: hypothetical protein F4245_01920 [Cenarchaeum sp. SB0678_bin_8]|nr:hypothetical protein [Cenarchaeum sp. SB0678_bin_8]
MGKPVNDMYGAFVGKAAGTSTDIDGTVTFVGVDCGLQGLIEIPMRHLVIQEESIVYVPQWRLDSQKILREKTFLVRRLQALKTILLENEDMKEDSEPIRQFYEEKLDALKDAEDVVSEALANRLAELEQQTSLAKSIHFDATIQYKSSEIVELDYKTAKTELSTILERIDYEIEEIKSMQDRLAEQSAAEIKVRDIVVSDDIEVEHAEDISSEIPIEQDSTTEAPAPIAEVTAPVEEAPIMETAAPVAEAPLEEAPAPIAEVTAPVEEAPMTAVMAGISTTETPAEIPSQTPQYNIPEPPSSIPAYNIPPPPPKTYPTGDIPSSQMPNYGIPPQADTTTDMPPEAPHDIPKYNITAPSQKNDWLSRMTSQ